MRFPAARLVFVLWPALAWLGARAEVLEIPLTLPSGEGGSWVRAAIEGDSMERHGQQTWTRRRFLGTLACASLGGTMAPEPTAATAALARRGERPVETHPGLDTPEVRAIHHLGYPDVALDRQGVTDTMTSPQVKPAIKAKGIQLISYRDLKK